jgi:integrase
MVRLQLLTGMRPGEVVAMRGLELEMTGPVWAYRPGSDAGPHGRHKTAHRGQPRVVLLGPRAQEVLRPWLRPNLQEYLFQPREAMERYRPNCAGSARRPSRRARRIMVPAATPGAPRATATG